MSLPSTAEWFDEWWLRRRAEYVAERLEKEAEDPGVPALLWLSSPAPVSFVAAARHKIPAVFNLDKLHREVLGLYGVKPA